MDIKQIKENLEKDLNKIEGLIIVDIQEKNIIVIHCLFDEGLYCGAEVPYQGESYDIFKNKVIETLSKLRAKQFIIATKKAGFLTKVINKLQK